MPDGSVSLKSLSHPNLIDPLGLEWSRMSANSTEDDLAALQASVRFAELAVEAAKQDALDSVREQPENVVRDPADPLDQVAADWVAKTEADEKIIHAFLGIDDPIGREATATFEDDGVDVALDAFLENLPDDILENGELAALSAFDEALASGSDAEEALSAAILAAEQTDASITVGAAIAESPRGIGLGLDTAAFLNPPSEPDDAAQQRDAVPEVVPAPFIASISGETLAAFVGGQIESSDVAFGFGFQFASDPVQTFVPASNRTPPDRSTIETQTLETVTYTSIVGTAATDLLVGGASQDAIAALGSDDYVYADQPTNYDAIVHDASNPLTNPTFSGTGGDDLISGGAGDDYLWGGAGSDHIHGDVPDTSSGLFAEFSFGLGSAVGGGDRLYGGDGNDSLWGGDGADVISGDAGSDYLAGEGGADQLFGGAGNDNLFGYAGDDIIQGGQGDDTLAGGDGADSFEFAGGSGATVVEHVQSLGVDTISDYSAADLDTLALSHADFGFGNTGFLTDGTNYFEIADGTLSASPFDISNGSSGSAILVMGANSGADGVGVYYTEDASAATNLNSYQIADIISVNASDFEAADFLLKS